MQHTPSRQNGRLSAVCIPLITLAFVLFALSRVLPYAGILQGVGGILSVAFLFLTIRFSLSSYRYEIDADSLFVYRRQGKREEALCSISLSSILALYTKKTYKENSPSHALRYNFCQNLGAKDAVYLLFVFDDVADKRAVISFEPSEEMLTFLKQYEREV